MPTSLHSFRDSFSIHVPSWFWFISLIFWYLSEGNRFIFNLVFFIIIFYLWNLYVQVCFETSYFTWDPILFIEGKQLRGCSTFSNGLWNQGTKDHSTMFGCHSETHVPWSGIWGNVKILSELCTYNQIRSFLKERIKHAWYLI